MFLQARCFPEGATRLRCVLTDSVLHAPEEAVLLYVVPRDETCNALFVGFIERSYALVIQVCSFACDPVNSIVRSFRRYLRYECNINIRDGQLDPPLSNREEMHLYVQAFRDSATHLFGEYWDSRCILQDANKSFLYGYEILTELMPMRKQQQQPAAF